MTEGTSQDSADTRRVVSACYAAARANDAAAILELMDPDVVLREPASLPNAGVHRGVDQVMQALVPVFALFDLSRLTIEKIVVDGEYGIGLVDLPFRDRAGQSCEVSEVYRVRNGRVVEIRPFYWDTAAIAAMSP
jgi:uncharacterized protein